MVLSSVKEALRAAERVLVLRSIKIYMRITLHTQSQPRPMVDGTLVVSGTNTAWSLSSHRLEILEIYQETISTGTRSRPKISCIILQGEHLQRLDIKMVQAPVCGNGEGWLSKPFSAKLVIWILPEWSGHLQALPPSTTTVFPNGQFANQMHVQSYPHQLKRFALAEVFKVHRVPPALLREPMKTIELLLFQKSMSIPHQ